MPRPCELPVAGIGEGSRHAVDHLGQGRQAAAGPVDADPHQGNADHHDDGAGDDRREQRQQSAHERRDDDGEDAGRNHRTVNAEKSDVGRRSHRQHRADRGEGHAHHHRQADADAGKADALHECRQSAGEQVGADQKGDVLGRQFERAAENERNGNRARIHDQDMLKPERQKLGYRQELVDRMNVLRHLAAPRKRVSREHCDTKTMPDRETPFSSRSDDFNGPPPLQEIERRSNPALTRCGWIA